MPAEYEEDERLWGSIKKWDEEEESDSGSSTGSPATAAAIAAGRRKFDDEEDDSDVLESWDAAEDSEVEREKAKKAAEVKAKADAEAAANKKSKKQRIEELRAERARQLAEGDDGSEDESEGERRERLKRNELESDLKHAADLFGGIGVSNNRKAVTAGAAVPIDPKDPTKTINLGTLPLLNPQTKLQFENMRNTLVPIIGGNSKKAHYTLFLQEFSKQLAKDLPSDQIKKIASTLTALSNEKMKEEKAADKSGKKSKAQKTKTSVVIGRSNPAADTATYEDDFGDDDFM
ncbi:Eukaryotic translation initiation factor 3 subunit J [Apiospora arundinis]